MRVWVCVCVCVHVSACVDARECVRVCESTRLSTLEKVTRNDGKQGGDDLSMIFTIGFSIPNLVIGLIVHSQSLGASWGNNITRLA